jgi:hypothetical protein
MSDSNAPAAGWYPAPHAGNEQRYWDGAQWTEPQPAPVASAPLTDPSAPAPGWYPAPDGSSAPVWWDGSQWRPDHLATVQPSATRLAGLAAAAQVLLVVTVLVSVVTIGVESFRLGAVTRFLGGDDAAIDQLTTYDQITLPLSILGLIFLIATGIVWVIWQYRAAKSVIGRTRRSPGWHAGAWFVPVISFWFPYQNISDLWQAIGRPRPRWQIVWWLAWIASSVFGQIAGRLTLIAESLDQYAIAMWMTIASELLMIVAAPFAFLVLRGITRGLAARAL